MKINFKLLSLLSVFLGINTSYASLANPSDIDNLNKYNACVACDLSETKISNKDNVNLAHSILTKTEFVGHFYNSNFSSANLSYAKMRSVQASGSNFSSASLVKADLAYSNLARSDLSNANLSAASLYKANLVGARVTKDQLLKADNLNCTIFPDGSVPYGSNC